MQQQEGTTRKKHLEGTLEKPSEIFVLKETVRWMNQKDAPEWNNQVDQKAILKGRAFMDALAGPKRKAEPSWTP